MAEAPKPSGIRAVFDRALQLEAEGREIVHLEIGRPHVGSPEVAVEAARAALAGGDVHYTANRGTPSLRAALAERLPYDPATEIVVTTGGSEAVFAAFRGLLQPGDEVLVPTPAWPHYDALARLVGAVPVLVPCRAEDGFAPDPAALAAAVSPRTRMLVVSSPSNPTGAVFGRHTLEQLAALCRDRDLVALSDEIYRRFADDHVSIATLDGMRERTVIADSCSKTYAMTGWRVGWIAAPVALMGPIATVHQYVAVCAPSFAQAGAEAAIRHAEPFVEALTAEYAQRRATVRARLTAVSGIELPAADGAFYAFPRIPGAGPGFAARLLEEGGVAVVPGEVFGPGLEDHVRLSYGVSAAQLDAGLDGLIAAAG